MTWILLLLLKSLSKSPQSSLVVSGSAPWRVAAAQFLKVVNDSPELCWKRDASFRQIKSHHINMSWTSKFLLFFFLTDSVFLPKWHLCISFLNKAGQTPSCVHLISNISSKLFEQLRDFLSLLPIFKLNFVCYCFITWLLPCIPTTCKIETSRSSFLSR